MGEFTALPRRCCARGNIGAPPTVGTPWARAVPGDQRGGKKRGGGQGLAGGHVISPVGRLHSPTPRRGGDARSHAKPEGRGFQRWRKTPVTDTWERGIRAAVTGPSASTSPVGAPVGEPPGGSSDTARMAPGSTSRSVAGTAMAARPSASRQTEGDRSGVARDEPDARLHGPAAPLARGAGRTLRVSGPGVIDGEESIPRPRFGAQLGREGRGPAAVAAG